MSSEVFPALAGLEYPVKRTPVFSNLVQQSVSGDEVRAALWSLPRWKWTLSFEFLRDDANNEFRTLCGFYLARRGSLDSFLYNDVDDNSVTGEQIGIGDGVNHDFQLQRTWGGFTEPVLSPLFQTIYKNGVAVASGGVSFVGPGLVHLSVAPGAGVVVTADIVYLWPVRFVADEVDFSKFMDKRWEQKKLEIISLKRWP